MRANAIIVVTGAIIALPGPGIGDAVPAVGLAVPRTGVPLCLLSDGDLSRVREGRAVELAFDGAPASGPIRSVQVDTLAAGCESLAATTTRPTYAAHFIPADAGEPTGPLFVLLDSQWSVKATEAGWTLVRAGGDEHLTLRACSSSEGLHVTLWSGQPLSGVRVWHRYLYLGYDVEPTCTPPEVNPS